MGMLQHFHHQRTTTWSKAVLGDWLEIDTTAREKRQFLEDHLELLDERSMTALEEGMAHFADEPDTVEWLRGHHEIMRYALALGGDQLVAAREACINQFGGITLDPPGWLAAVEAELTLPETSQPEQRNSRARIQLLREAIARAENERPAIEATIVAALRVDLFDELRADVADAGSARIDEAIAALLAALPAYPCDRYPYQHANLQTELGNAYASREIGSPADNLERSFEALQCALACCPREQDPLLWGRIQRSLAYTHFLRRLFDDPEGELQHGITRCESAFEVFKEETDPEQWAYTMMVSGNLHHERVTGGRLENVERAIDCYRAALRVFTIEAYPTEFALLHTHLGIAYRNRLSHDPVANAEVALIVHREALRVYTRAAYPVDYAMTLCYMADASLVRQAISTSVNIESALLGYQEALRILTLEDHPQRYAMAQNGLGLAYTDRPGGRVEDVERAIAAFREALRVRTEIEYPVEHVQTKINLGGAYLKRQLGIRADNLADALACFHDAARICVPEIFPVEHRMCQISIAQAEAERGNWAGAHAGYERAEAIERNLLRQEVGEEARVALLREGRDTTIRNGYALARLGRGPEAAVAIERGRARGLADWLAMDAISADSIADADLRARLTGARARFTEARATLYAPLHPVLDQNAYQHEWQEPERAAEVRRHEAERTAAFHAARTALDDIVAEARAAGAAPDFLEETSSPETILRAAQVAPGHAIIYIAATPWGGVAVGAFSGSSSSRAEAGEAHFAHLELPELIVERVFGLVHALLADDALHIIGGFEYAQRGSGMAALTESTLALQVWPGETFRARARAIYDACLGVGKPSTISAAAQTSLKLPTVATLADRPLTSLSADEMAVLEGTINHLHLQLELHKCLNWLAETVMRPLWAWLKREGARSVTLIPCGFLEVFPLLAAPLADGRPFGGAIAASVAPSAHALLAGRSTSGVPAREGVYTLGDPRPTHMPLRWAEAEALTLAKLARLRGLHGEARVQAGATREWLIAALNQGQIVDASCHGAFHALDVLRSLLILAHGETLTLADVLGGQVHLGGLRLLILSACQTAIPDVRSQTVEVRSLAAGMIQAGAQAVLASLWPVDDRAAFILVVRFAQEWLPQMDREPPAAALAHAQDWIRTLSYRKLRAWTTTSFADSTSSELIDTGAGQDWTAPWRAERPEEGDGARKIPVRGGRGTRFSVFGAQRELRHSDRDAPDDVRPFADPIYWAGFQIVGW